MILIFSKGKYVMKLKLSLTILLVVICISISFLFISKNYQYTSYTITKKENHYIETENIETNNIHQENISETLKEKDSIKDTANKENKKTEESKKENTFIKEEKKESQEPPVDSTTDEIVIEEKIDKHICTDLDTKYKKWLSNYLKINSSTRIFNSLEESKKYGEQLLSLDYGYFYGRSPITYEDEFCIKEMYTLQLYIPSDTCGGNDMLYLPNNIEDIHAISYLRNLGYSCPEKIIKN